MCLQKNENWINYRRSCHGSTTTEVQNLLKRINLLENQNEKLAVENNKLKVRNQLITK